MEIGKDGRVAIELPDGEVIRRYPVDATEIMRAKDGAKLCEDCEALPQEATTSTTDKAADSTPTRDLRSKAGVIAAIHEEIGDGDLGAVLTDLDLAADVDLESLPLAQLRAVLEAVAPTQASLADPEE